MHIIITLVPWLLLTVGPSILGHALNVGSLGRIGIAFIGLAILTQITLFGAAILRQIETGENIPIKDD